MDKILVEVFLPAGNSSYDVYIPLRSKLSEILPLICKVVGDLSDGKYKTTAETALCDRKSGIIYNIDLSAEELGIKNGSQLMLV